MVRTHLCKAKVCDFDEPATLIVFLGQKDVLSISKGSRPDTDTDLGLEVAVGYIAVVL